MKVLVTGAAGFIGFHLTLALLERGDEVVGVDNLNDYYDPRLKQDRLNIIDSHACADAFTFVKEDIADREAMSALFKKYSFDAVVNLAAQAGVRYSIENPHAYVDANLVGFVNILEGCRNSEVGHLLYASSSSVYGMNSKQPFSVEDSVDSPVSLYAATKKSNELLAFAYSHLYEIPTTGLRFFTVYGPYGRPDMAYFKFTKAILSGQPINVFNGGEMLRDFTYIDDIVQGVCELLRKVPNKTSKPNSEAEAPYDIYNIGNNVPVSLKVFIETIEKHCERTATKNMLPMQPGDVPATFADVDKLMTVTGFRPSTTLDEGVRKFVNWYRSTHLSNFPEDV